MTQISRLKVFQPGKKALSADINAEFDNIVQGVNNVDDEITNLKNSNGASNIGTSQITGVTGDNVQDMLSSLKNSINQGVLGQIPNGSITEEKLAFNPATQTELDDLKILSLWGGW